MLNKENFIDYIISNIEKYISNDNVKYRSIEKVSVVKVNDQKLQGISFVMEIGEPAPTIYLDDYYLDYCDGKSLEAILENIANRYLEISTAHDMSVISENATGFEAIEVLRKKDIALRVVNKYFNEEFLSNKPYMDLENDLVLICDIRVSSDKNGVYSVVVDDNMLKNLNISKDNLFSKALSSSWQVDPPVLVSMSDKLFSTGKENYFTAEIEKPINEPMYVLSTSSAIYGAAALFYPDIQERLATMFGSYYAIPSSIQEFLIIPDSVRIPAKDIKKMLIDANSSVVSRAEILSNNVYHYDNIDHKLHKLEDSITSANVDVLN